MTDQDVLQFESEVLGDALEYAKLGTSLVSEVAQGAISEVQKKKQADALAAAQKARAAANDAARAAESEKDPNGKLHNTARDLDAKAKDLEQKAGLQMGASMVPTSGPSYPSTPSSLSRMAGPLPVYGWLIVGVLGVSVLGGIVYAMRKK